MATELDPTKPFANLTFARMFCALHGEPFRAEWPRGAVVFQLKGLKIVLDQDESERHALAATVNAPEDGTTRSIELLLDRKPVCCRLPKPRLLGLYRESSIGTRARCMNCRRKQLGTSLRSRRTDGSVITMPHVCFECVVFCAYEGMS